MPSKKTAQKQKTTTSTPTTTTTTSEVTTKKAETKPKVVEQPKPEPEPIIENKVIVDKESNTIESLNQFMQNFQNILTQFNQLKVELKSLEKKTVKDLKHAEKSKNKKKKGTRAPSGFVKPAPISDELAIFLGIPTGSEMARTEVTREINKYIREHQLQDKTNGRKIIPDKKLSTLLKVNADIDLTYFNLQRYMGPHFPKQTKQESVATA